MNELLPVAVWLAAKSPVKWYILDTPCPPQLLTNMERSSLPGDRPTLKVSWLEDVGQGKYANHRGAFVPVECGA